MDSTDFNQDYVYLAKSEKSYLSTLYPKTPLDRSFSIQTVTKIRSESIAVNNKVSIDDFKIIKKIGKGSYAKVVLAKKIQTSKSFAIKIINKQFIEKENKINEAHIEKQILSELSHPNIIKLHYSFHDEKRLYYVFELAEKGDLKEYLNYYGTPSYAYSKFIIAELINALEYLHKKEIVHRDLKPENIVINEKNNIKLIDFATATYIGKYFDLKEKAFKEDNQIKYNDNGYLVGTADYLSPEMISDNTCGYEADLWALGCVIYQLFHNSLPFTGFNNNFVINNITQNKMDKIDKRVPNDVKDLILSLLVNEPGKRLGANRNFIALKSHSFFKGIVFNDIHLQEHPIGINKRNYTSYSLPDISFDFQFLDNEEIVNVDKSNIKSERRSEKMIILNKLDSLRNISTFTIYEEIVKKKSPWFHFNRRKLILFNNKLEYYDPIALKKKGEIMLNKKSYVKSKDSYTFEVITLIRTFEFKCEKPESVVKWCDNIQLVIHFLNTDDGL